MKMILIFVTFNGLLFSNSSSAIIQPSENDTMKQGVKRVQVPIIAPQYKNDTIVIQHPALPNLKASSGSNC